MERIKLLVIGKNKTPRCFFEDLNLYKYTRITVLTGIVESTNRLQISESDNNEAQLEDFITAQI